MNKLTIQAAIVLANHTRLLLQHVRKDECGGLCMMLVTLTRHNHEIYQDLPEASYEDFREGWLLIRKVWTKWPRCSGDPYFPIRAPWWCRFVPKSEEDYFQSSKNFTGRRLRERKALMDFTHQYLQNMLKEHS